jgi:hypothetical protein
MLFFLPKMDTLKWYDSEHNAHINPFALSLSKRSYFASVSWFASPVPAWSLSHQSLPRSHAPRSSARFAGSLVGGANVGKRLNSAFGLRQQPFLVPHWPLRPAFSPDWGTRQRSRLWREGSGGWLSCLSYCQRRFWRKFGHFSDVDIQ